ncbi:DNA primase [Actinomyces culturomici]|uniref:DNA primase n=1 Tax=Actinomyces culturomici TaxID=1926276 RepID=UPI000E20A74B|nr:DNA primase [Actinomyces culturomici]
MSEEPGAALEALIVAFREHYVIARAGEGADVESLEFAEDKLRDAFFTYDDELFTTYGVELPFDLLDDDYEEGDEDDDEFVDVDD